MPSVCFLIGLPLDKRIYELFGIDVFLRKGFSVRILDITPVLYRDAAKLYASTVPLEFKFLQTVRTRQDLTDAIREFQKELWIVLVDCNPQTRFIYQSFKKRAVRYIQYAMATVPVASSSWLSRWRRLRKDFNLRWVFTQAAQWAMRFTPRSWMGLQPPAFLLAAGMMSKTKSLPAADVRTQIIWAHTWDYDAYLKQKQTLLKSTGDICVYLDEYVPFHPDYFLHEGMDPHVNADQYYVGLRRSFEFVESKLGVPVVIAAHPKSDYASHPGVFGGRRVEKNKTLELVARSKLVLMQASTAINFAVICRKPLLFLSLDCLRNTYIENYIACLSRALHKAPFNIDRDPSLDLEKEMTVNDRVYDEYRERYIKTAGSPEKPLWEIVIDHV